MNLPMTYKRIGVLHGRTPFIITESFHDLNQLITRVSYIELFLGVIILSLTIHLLWQIKIGKRKIQNRGAKGINILFMSIIGVILFGLCLYYLPNILFYNLTWTDISTRSPQTALIMIITTALLIILACAYMILRYYFPKPGKKPYFSLVILSIVSGFGNSAIMMIITQALSAKNSLKNWAFYFSIAILIYIFTQKYIRTKLINLANDIVYEKRMELVEKILKTIYYKLENIETGRIYSCLNNDMELISNSMNAIVQLITSMVVIVFCFIYLGFMSFYGLLFSILFVGLAFGLQFFVNQRANKIWEETRDIQNHFFKFISDLIGGFKELNLHHQKSDEFQADMGKSCNTYRTKQIKAQVMFADTLVISQLIIYFVIGSVVFIFPLLFREIQAVVLRNYVFVFLFLVGPVSNVLSMTPFFSQAKISWKRVTDLTKEISLLISEKRQVMTDITFDSMELRNVEYSYRNTEQEVFSVGPIDCTFNRGEIVFITGGNGSGKTTLAKLITGLYIPHKGEIFINGITASMTKLGEYFSPVFSDFYLFDKLYGIDNQIKSVEIEKYLKILQIDEKVNITENEISTLKLSTGQRKRLALLLCFLDDRPIYLFDEWAADQDPEFRNYFYRNLLPEMKQKGKCVIAITHDDRYFDVADRMYKMEMGKIVKQNYIQTVIA